MLIYKYAINILILQSSCLKIIKSKSKSKIKSENFRMNIKRLFTNNNFIKKYSKRAKSVLYCK